MCSVLTWRKQYHVIKQKGHMIKHKAFCLYGIFVVLYLRSKNATFCDRLSMELQQVSIPIVLGNGWWTADGYVIIIVYLHKIPVTFSPWNIACYVMITVDRPSPSMIPLPLGNAALTNKFIAVRSTHRTWQSEWLEPITGPMANFALVVNGRG